VKPVLRLPLDGAHDGGERREKIGRSVGRPGDGETEEGSRRWG
jgi:hypothetical protein